MDTIEVLGHRPEDPPDTMPFRKLGFATAIGGVGQKFFATYYNEPNQGPWTIIRVALKGVLATWASLPGLRRIPLVSDKLRSYGQLLSGTRAKVSADGKTFPYTQFQGLHAGSINVDFGTMKLFPYAAEPGKLHLVAGDVGPLKGTFLWPYLVVGKSIPHKTWHEFSGETMEVLAEGDDLLDPVIDGEMFFGFDRIKVRLGKNITVPGLDYL